MRFAIAMKVGERCARAMQRRPIFSVRHLQLFEPLLRVSRRRVQHYGGDPRKAD